MQKFYHKCAALLLAVGLLFPCTTALAQMREEDSMAVGLSPVDSGLPQIHDSGYDSGSVITYTAPWNEDEPFFTTTRAEWTLAMLPKPDTGWLFPVEDIGNFDALRKFSIRWNQADYDAGLASGAEQFIITGSYVPANAEDQALWDKGLLLVDETSVPKMEVRVTNAAALPFRVELGYYAAADGYYPIFACPTPNGASKVRFEASEDGTHWFTHEKTYNIAGEFSEKSSIYPMSYAFYTEDGEPFFFDAHKQSYYRVTVYGSAYDANGCGAQSTFTLNAVPGETAPPGSDLDDTGGNRGGGAQGETDRPGKLNKKDTPSKTEQQSKLQPSPAADKPELIPTATEQSPTESAQTPPVSAAAPSGGIENTASPTGEADSPERSGPASHPDDPANPPSSSDTLEALAPLAAEPQPPPDNGHAGTVAAITTAILVAGAGGTYLFKQRRKP